MTITVHPVNAVTGAPSYSGKMHRQVLSVGLEGATATRQLGARSGVRKGTPSSTVTATTAILWTVTPFSGLIDLETSATAGAYWFASDTNVTGAINAANATNPRVDIISVKIDDPAESDGSSVPAVTINYTAGTAAPSPVAPSTPARSFVIANINVPTSGGGNPTVTWNAPYEVASGGIIPVRSQAERDAITYGTSENPVYVYRLDLGAIECSVASGVWTQVAGGTVANNTYSSILTGTLATDLTPSTNPPAAYTNVISFALPSTAPAGRYRVSARIGMRAQATAASAQIRIKQASTVLDESRADVEVAINRFYALEGYFDHAGGAVTLTLDVLCGNTIWILGSTNGIVRAARI